MNQQARNRRRKPELALAGESMGNPEAQDFATLPSDPGLAVMRGL
jgi:hypothetical protein